jgi:hypothetical protein
MIRAARNSPTYHLTSAGRKALAKQRSMCDTFLLALARVGGIRHD